MTQREGSNVVRVSPSQRLVHLATILPVTSTNSVATHGNKTTLQRRPLDFRVYAEASAWLAWYHLTNPERHVLPQIRDRLRDCDIRFSLELRDTRHSSISAARELVDLVTRKTTNENKNISFKSEEHYDLKPAAIVGASRSAGSTVLSFLNSAYDIAQVSASSTARSLDNKDSHPLFSRTVPSNAGEAQAFALYLQSLGVTHFGVLHVRDSFGNAYALDVAREAILLGIQVRSFSYEGGTIEENASMESAVKQLSRSGLRYIFGIFESSSWKLIVRLAARHGVMGSRGYQWFLAEASLENPSFFLNRYTEDDLARALHGSALVLLNIPMNPQFHNELDTFSTDIDRQGAFISNHHEPEIFEDYTFRDPGHSFYQDLTYDAVMTLAIASCECEREYFTGQELYAQILKTEFLGVSGPVSFDPTTGTRESENFAVHIHNLVMSKELSERSLIRFTANTSAVVHLSHHLGQQYVERVQPFVYADSTHSAPPCLPDPAMEMNLIPSSVRAGGLALPGLVMLASIAWMIWTLVYRKHHVVMSSQPVFLVQLCVGTLIMASAVIPMSLQEPISQHGLNVACMSGPWLTSIGFVTAFSALFSKARRLNKLFKSGSGMRRIKVEARDVMLPFFILMVINISLLTSWTIVSPLTWRRIAVDNYDAFGRSVESYGKCQPINWVTTAYFLAPLALVNLIALGFAKFQAYQARDLPTEYSESNYLGLSMGSLLEIFVLAIPLLFLTIDKPSTSFLIRSILISASCLAIQLPIFLPKYVRKGKARLQAKSSGRKDGARQSIVVVSGITSMPRSRSPRGLFDEASDDGSQGSGRSRAYSVASRRSAKSPVGKSRVVRSEDYYAQRASGDLVTRTMSRLSSVILFPVANEGLGAPSDSRRENENTGIASTQTAQLPVCQLSNHWTPNA